MNRLIINLEALHHNLRVIDGWLREHGGTWTVVTKMLCGQPETLRALWAMGVRSVGDSRLRNLRSIQEALPEQVPDVWYLRVPSLSSVGDVVALSGISLNSETSIIEAINQEAARQGRIHRVVIMIELGDLREGILPGSLIRFYEQVFDLPHIEVVGIGSNLGCISGQVPTVDQYMQLVLYHQLLELKFEHQLPIISAGSSVTLPLLLQKQLPKAVNHLRIGESLFLGNDLITGAELPGLRSDTLVLEAEIVEIKRKSLIPVGPGGTVAPFTVVESGPDIVPGQRGYRALVNIGQLDTDIQGISPEDPSFQIAGASSDITVVNVGDTPADLRVGGTLRFRVSYAAALRLMSGPYVPKAVEPSIERFEAALPGPERLAVPPLHVMAGHLREAS
jgi:predicted amino acid racemase